MNVTDHIVKQTELCFFRMLAGSRIAESKGRCFLNVLTASSDYCIPYGKISEHKEL
jgi:hypothetical protein